MPRSFEVLGVDDLHTCSPDVHDSAAYVREHFDFGR